MNLIALVFSTVIITDCKNGADLGALEAATAWRLFSSRFNTIGHSLESDCIPETREMYNLDTVGPLNAHKLDKWNADSDANVFIGFLASNDFGSRDTIDTLTMHKYFTSGLFGPDRYTSRVGESYLESLQTLVATDDFPYHTTQNQQTPMLHHVGSRTVFRSSRYRNNSIHKAFLFWDIEDPGRRQAQIAFLQREIQTVGELSNLRILVKGINEETSPGIKIAVKSFLIAALR